MQEIDRESVKSDINVMLWSMKLYHIRRYKKHRFWESETMDAEYADRIESYPRLESVAEHSWHVADSVLLLGYYFPSLDVDRCLRMAILHDKMEIYIGDKNPVGRSGTGEKTHAFNKEIRLKKDLSESRAIDLYLAKLSPFARSKQSKDLYEILEGSTEEACFVKALDKLQALGYVLIKKNGLFKDKHLSFTLKYSQKTVEYYPGLELHYDELKSRVFAKVAKYRNTSIENIKKQFESTQTTKQFTLFSTTFQEIESNKAVLNLS